MILPVLLNGLTDDCDDVRAAAADALLPIAALLCATRQHTAGSLITILWDSLLDLDELMISTASVLQLLSALLAKMETAAKQAGDDVGSYLFGS